MKLLPGFNHFIRFDELSSILNLSCTYDVFANDRGDFIRFVWKIFSSVLWHQIEQCDSDSDSARQNEEHYHFLAAMWLFFRDSVFTKTKTNAHLSDFDQSEHSFPVVTSQWSNNVGFGLSTSFSSWGSYQGGNFLKSQISDHPDPLALNGSPCPCKHI